MSYYRKDTTGQRRQERFREKGSDRLAPLPFHFLSPFYSSALSITLPLNTTLIFSFHLSPVHSTYLRSASSIFPTPPVSSPALNYTYLCSVVIIYLLILFNVFNRRMRKMMMKMVIYLNINWLTLKKRMTSQKVVNLVLGLVHLGLPLGQHPATVHHLVQAADRGVVLDLILAVLLHLPVAHHDPAHSARSLDPFPDLDHGLPQYPVPPQTNTSHQKEGSQTRRGRGSRIGETVQAPGPGNW